MKINDEHVAALLLGLPNTNNVLVSTSNGSYKFWCIYEENGKIMVTYGKIGTKPRYSDTGLRGTLDKNSYNVEYRINQKLSDGYKKLLDII